ncbi:MAG: hypothetical protein PHE83_00390 [Opitutaceae bacterium]|nr:hypothetical protein [Opitutaceae bacterium]
MSPEMVIALLAIVFAAYQAYLSRQHNRVSLRPSVGTDIRWHMKDEGIELSYLLVNYGLGPARVASFDLLFGKEEFPSVTHAPIEEMIRKACGGSMDVNVEHSGMIQPGYCILAQREYLLLRAFFRGLKRGDESRIKSVLEPLDFRLVYESVYGEKFELTSVGAKKG